MPINAPHLLMDLIVNERLSGARPDISYTGRAIWILRRCESDTPTHGSRWSP
ncbi:hypothetical protein FIBSPDRAFT_857971 [Athelia psychrophila]|uniref:Uncharacterized protein n=1 Tax=Athelia psychrophila TaxID=1759441 RepID=A0A166MBE7_9AGAM|nr:hypothetical protein FIBSPDRAFT_857971 [Fibularhizoctonia sp. CBS 109695]